MATHQHPSDGEPPVFEVSAYDHPELRWYVSVDDEIASEQDEALDELVAELSGAPGVTRAVREDREVLLVAGPVSREQLVELLGAWWATRPAPYAAGKIESGGTVAEQDVDRGPEGGAPGALGPADLLTPEATAIAGFAFAVFSMLGQGSWSIAITALFWGDGYAASNVPGVMVGWGVGTLVMAGLGGWLARRTLQAGARDWPAHLARAAVLVAAVGALLSVLTVVGAFLQ